MVMSPDNPAITTDHTEPSQSIAPKPGLPEDVDLASLHYKSVASRKSVDPPATQTDQKHKQIGQMLMSVSTINIEPKKRQSGVMSGGYQQSILLIG